MLGEKEKQSKKVLVFRQGSLGDAIVALPCFRLIKHAFPKAKIYVLTNKPINHKACAMEAVLENTNLVDEYLAYPASHSLFKKFFIIRRLIKTLGVDMLVYLIECPTRIKRWRDFLFFKLCGIKKIVGLRLFGKKSDYLYFEKKACYEYEGKRLARQIAPVLGKVNWSDPDAQDLSITGSEKKRLYSTLPSDWLDVPFLVCSIGTKFKENDWGDNNWLKLIEFLSERYIDFGLAFVGVQGERERSQLLLNQWSGKKLNMCGKLNVRQSAVFLSLAKLFIGHDSGPMHLAAAVGTTCVGIFSRKNKPGCWFPHGKKHKTLYPKGDSIFSISVSDVVIEVESAIDAGA